MVVEAAVQGREGGNNGTQGGGLTPALVAISWKPDLHKWYPDVEGSTLFGSGSGLRSRLRLRSNTLGGNTALDKS